MCLRIALHNDCVFPHARLQDFQEIRLVIGFELLSAASTPGGQAIRLAMISAVLHYAALCCTMLHYAALCCTMLHSVFKDFKVVSYEVNPNIASYAATISAAGEHWHCACSLLRHDAAYVWTLPVFACCFDCVSSHLIQVLKLFVEEETCWHQDNPRHTTFGQGFQTSSAPWPWFPRLAIQNIRREQMLETRCNLYLGVWCIWCVWYWTDLNRFEEFFHVFCLRLTLPVLAANMTSNAAVLVLQVGIRPSAQVHGSLPSPFSALRIWNLDRHR